MAAETVNFDVLHPSPLLVVISGPSGVGKDAVLHEMKKRDLGCYFVVTATSRPARANEREGVDYFFVSRERFEQMVAGGELIEHAVVYDDYKGIPKQQVREAFASGRDVIMRVDVQGAERLRQLFPQAVLIFLIPRDETEWLQRLRDRKTETEDNFHLRVETAKHEMEKLSIFDYVVVNAQDRLVEAVDTIIAIIEAEHHRIAPRKVEL